MAYSDSRVKCGSCSTVFRTKSILYGSHEIQCFKCFSDNTVQFQATSEAPPWAEGIKCSQCDKPKFTFFDRKHHCRACGAVVCGDCCEKLELPHLAMKRERCCKKCLPEMKEKLQVPAEDPRTPRPGVAKPESACCPECMGRFTNIYKKPKGEFTTGNCPYCHKGFSFHIDAQGDLLAPGVAYGKYGTPTWCNRNINIYHSEKGRVDEYYIRETTNEGWNKVTYTKAYGSGPENDPNKHIRFNNWLVDKHNLLRSVMMADEKVGAITRDIAYLILMADDADATRAQKMKWDMCLGNTRKFV